MSLAFVFPGQGSQSIGMLDALADEFSEVKETFAEAAGVVGYDLWDIVQHGPADRLNSTHITQPAMLAADVAIARLLAQHGFADVHIARGGMTDWIRNGYPVSRA